MSYSTISNNSSSGDPGDGLGGGIDNEGQLTVMHSTFSHNLARSYDGGNSFGGGIDNDGQLTVTSSTFAHNSVSSTSGGASLGGGIFNHSHGTLTVTSSTFVNNSVSSSGNNSQGGGIDNDGQLTAITSTFWNNSVSSSGSSYGGGIFFYEGSSAIIRFCTIYGNTSSAGGGIWVDPTGSSHMTISSSIVAANSAPDGPDISGMLISDGYNLIGNFAGAKGFADTDRQVPFADLKINPALGNNGGLTQTLTLLQGSPAIDAVPAEACSIALPDASGHPVTITTDQRGDHRPDGSEEMCDIGAYESSY